MSERLNHPISTTELERRWGAVRTAMDAEGLDALVMQNNSETVGYARWFTDMPASSYPTTVLFPREGGMTVVAHGPLGDDRRIDDDDPVWRGVERLIGTASFPSAAYMREYDAELTLDAFEPFERAAIGLVGTSQMSLAFGERLRAALPGATFTEASEAVDSIKAAISRRRSRSCTALRAPLSPGTATSSASTVRARPKESEITVIARRAAHDLGSEAGIYLCGAGPPGLPAPIAPRHLQDRRFRDGDLFALLIEVDGPGGDVRRDWPNMHARAGARAAEGGA